ncbi:N-acetylneuraminate synthase [Cryomorphaceae bacterium 1068]|nr:N-acetylneuraminate synthase [Cryomorphaceae bacterium 1068]
MEKVLIIAEAGVNHNGDLEKAKMLIDAAAEARADFVKFQTFSAERIVSGGAKKATYQKNNLGGNDENQFNMLKKLELRPEYHQILIDYCVSRGIKFLSTGFDEKSIDFLDKLFTPLFKIPSGEITNKPYLEHIASKGKPVILSTGMTKLLEIEDALKILTEKGLVKDQITVLHCNTEYPTPMSDVNLKAMLQIKDELGVQVGYSDHTLGIEVPIAAVALGAKVIEKHFTLDRRMPGPDHAASLEPHELKAMVAAIRNIEAALSGDGKKKPSPSEQKNITVVRKSIHLNKSIHKGHIIHEDDLIMLRPGDGISPMKIDAVIGKSASSDLNKFDKLSLEDLS